MGMSRSENMRAVRGKNTEPEMIVRRLLHRLGYRYRLHGPNLPGKPDIVFPSRRKIIFVHGCFWHQHPKCRRASLPKENNAFWTVKLTGNRKRDVKHLRALKGLGWDHLIVWQCELKDPSLACRLERWLDGGPTR